MWYYSSIGKMGPKILGSIEAPTLHLQKPAVVCRAPCQAVSRALGDFHFKPSGMDPAKCKAGEHGVPDDLPRTFWIQ